MPRKLEPSSRKRLRRRRQALAAAVSCAAHAAVLGCLALMVGGGGLSHREALEVTASTVNDFDSTSSMGAEVDTVKERIVEIGGALMRKLPNTLIGVVTYKDYADTPTVAGVSLTKDLAQLNAFLAGVKATGGGTVLPEAVLPGLHWAMEHSGFRPKARKVVLLFGDAPPYPGVSATSLTVWPTIHGVLG